ncbi:MAG TPA: ankyrin repeat domain-containing protein [Gemmatimonadaceae bacterium]|nr:ankyrin repeat domain-containing protein [Gemmatimonadaceae bacterium]
MDTLPLPPSPDLAQYRKRAKELVAAARSSDPDAVHAWAADWLRALAKRLDVEITPFVQGSFDRAVQHIETRVREATKEGETSFGLSDAQFLIAQAHGFERWSEFANHVEPPLRGDAGGRTFEAAADAVVSGDLATLESLVRAHPDLVRARSPRVHRATLLHYVAANGVEDFRQRTPPDAVEIARFLLESGAAVDALAETYGGGTAQTTMNLLVSSSHPADAGLQSPLVELLLDFGAAINGLEDDGSPLMTALAFWYGGAAETLARRGARIDNAVAAAGVGREDLVRRFVIDRETLASDVRFFETRWFRTPREPRAHIEMAFVTACHFGRESIANFFLDLGVDVTARDKDEMTPLHWAAASGMSELVRRLVARGAPLEVKNTWGGTVLDSTAYFVCFMPVPGMDYRPVMETLIAAGADVEVLREYPRGHPLIDELRRRFGMSSE